MNVAASTQNQAFSALLFLYQDVLKEQLPWINDIVRVKPTAEVTGGVYSGGGAIGLSAFRRSVVNLNHKNLYLSLLLNLAVRRFRPH